MSVADEMYDSSPQGFYDYIPNDNINLNPPRPSV